METPAAFTFSDAALVEATCSAWESLLRVSLQSLFFFCHTPVSGATVRHVHLSGTNPGRAVDFSVCSTFSLLLGRSGDFQAPYMWNLEQDAFTAFFSCDTTSLQGFLWGLFIGHLVGRFSHSYIECSFPLCIRIFGMFNVDCLTSF